MKGAFERAKTLVTTHRRGKFYLGLRYATLVGSLLTWVLVLARGNTKIEADIIALSFGLAIFLFSILDILMAIPMLVPIGVDLILMIGLMYSIPYNIINVYYLSPRFYYPYSYTSHLWKRQFQGPDSAAAYINVPTSSLRTSSSSGNETTVTQTTVISFNNVLAAFKRLAMMDEEIKQALYAEVYRDTRAIQRQGNDMESKMHHEYRRFLWLYRQREYGIAILVFSFVTLVTLSVGWVILVRQCRAKTKMMREEEERMERKIGKDEEAEGIGMAI